MGMIAPDEEHDHRMVLELKGPVKQRAYEAYKREIKAIARKHHARVLVEHGHNRIKPAVARKKLQALKKKNT